MADIPYWLIRPFSWVVFHLLFLMMGGLRWEGREYVPRRGGVLIAPNHISDADPVAIGLALPRACYFMAKEELFDMRFLGTFIRWMRGFPVRRYTADRESLKHAQSLLEAGNAVVIFPEGKVSEDGKIQPLLPGALLVAQRACVPVVPAVVQGTERIVPYGKTMPRRSGRPSVVRFGPPVTVEELSCGQRGGAGLKRAAERLGAMLEALQQGRPYPQDTPTHDPPAGAPPADPA